MSQGPGDNARAPLVALHAYQPRTRANGPGARFALWFQGCSLGCPGCFNPDTHAPDVPDRPADPERRDERHTDRRADKRADRRADRRSVDSLIAEILAQGAAIEGISLSGGEPLEQAEAALALVRGVRQASALSILIFSGFTIEEIRARPLGAEILSLIDVLIDGRYQAPQRLGRHLRGSENQRVHLLSDRYTLEDIERTPEAEIIIDPQGRVVLSGVAPLLNLRKR